MIELKKIQKHYGPLHVLKGLDLELSKGQIYSLLGPNGSGKTSLIKTMLGLVIPDSGWIGINGEIVNGQWKYREQITYLPQIARFPENLRVNEVIQLVTEVRGVSSKPGPYIEAFELEEQLNKKLKHLSGGTRQKVNLVLCLMFDAPIIILDEPTTGLDPITLIRLKEILLEKRKEGKTIVLCTHILQLAEELADEIIFLLDGTIYFQGRLEKIFATTNSVDLEHAIAHLLQMNKRLNKGMHDQKIKMVI